MAYTGYKKKFLPAVLLIGASGVAYYVIKNMSGKKLSKAGLDFLKREEGFRNKAYKDAKGYWTIGVGHLILPDEKELLTKTLTNAEVNALLKKDVARFEKAVNDSLKVPVSQNQFDALVSLAFNIGEAGFKGSSVLKAVNQKKQPSEIYNMFLNWTSGGLLTKRRIKEANLFNKNLYA